MSLILKAAIYSTMLPQTIPSMISSSSHLVSVVQPTDYFLIVEFRPRKLSVSNL